MYTIVGWKWWGGCSLSVYCLWQSPAMQRGNHKLHHQGKGAVKNFQILSNQHLWKRINKIRKALKKLGPKKIRGATSYMEAPQEYHTGRQISVFVWMQVRCWPESLVSPTEGHMTFTWGHLKTRVKFTRFQRFLLGYEKKVFNWQIQHCPLRLLAWALLLGSGHVK